MLKLNVNSVLMKRRLLFIFLWLAAVAVQAQYKNPVIPGYHPDPSVCRVGNDFYLVNSSFQYFPGVPVYHSTDMVNWELIGNALDRQSQLPLKGASSWLGIYAPTIRYHDGTYYMITTNVGNGGNFMVTAKDPRGPWSEPLWLEQQGIDPSLWFENGKCYMVSNPDNTITLCQIDPKTGKQLTPSKALWQGTGGRYPEGPHIYKKDGWYYLLISEGGTELAHRLTIARSRRIEGPYEANPANPLLTHCSMAGQGSQIQGTGHGDFVQGPDGRWWIVFLAYRNFGGSYHHLGRETFLAPVEWKPGQWPVVNGGQPVDTLMQVRLSAATPLAQTTQQPRHIRTTFESGKLGPEWVYIQNPDSSKYRYVDGKLRLIASANNLSKNDVPTFVGRRQESAVFTAETKVEFFESMTKDEAGISLYQIHDGHVDFCIAQGKENPTVCLNVRVKSIDYVKKTATLPRSRCWLRVRSDGLMYYFEYSTDGQRYREFDRLDCSLLSTEVVGGFTGVVMGLYASMNPSYVGTGNSYADFYYFDYQEQ